MKKSKLISKWYRLQESIELDESLIQRYSQEVARLQNKINTITKALDSKRKEVFGVRLAAIGATDPIEEYLRNQNG